MAGSLTFNGKVQGVKTEAKTLLRNVLRHTDTHNRLLEENEMWNQHHQRKKEEKEQPSSSSGRKHSRSYHDGSDRLREPDVKNSFLYDDRQEVGWRGSAEKRISRRAHMDDDEAKYSSRESTAGGQASTYWMRQLQKTEEDDSERWGHNGFKELYPAIFDSDRSLQGDSSSEDSDTSSDHFRKRVKRSKHKSGKKERHKLDDREQAEKKRRHKKRKMKRKHAKKYSDSESEDGKSHRKKRKKKHRREREEDETSSDSSDLGKKKKKKKLKDRSEDGYKKRKRK